MGYLFEASLSYKRRKASAPNPKNRNTRYSQAMALKFAPPLPPASGKFMAAQHHKELCFCNLSRPSQRYKTYLKAALEHSHKAADARRPVPRKKACA
ncbi:hypothetical protein [Agrobacterium arsenijevicii]|uniref:hypothetical protein n=1 Tax=Agrobacterium arsenijevicii TaxID=1585697 RepID=UPI0011124E20